MAAQTREQSMDSLAIANRRISTGLGYYYYGKEVVKETIYYWKSMRDHSKLFRLKWPFVLVGTIITHRFLVDQLVEGTAVQMEAQ
jgi:hypothetical protein